jgi:hypothetical protein
MNRRSLAEFLDHPSWRRPELALRKAPLAPASYRRLGLFPVRRGRVRFTEDPREQDDRIPDDLDSSFGSWRSLGRAKRRAMGDVIYVRVSWRALGVFDDRPTIFSGRAVAVAFRSNSHSHWITDWDALGRARNLAHPKVDLDPSWEDFLTEEDRRYLEMMRFLHRAGSREDFRRRAQNLLDRSAAADFVDEAWIWQVKETTDENPRVSERWEVVIGSDLIGRKAGDALTLEEAIGLAELAIGRARDELAAQLAAKGGLAAEMAAHRSSWPAPKIHLVPKPGI